MDGQTDAAQRTVQALFDAFAARDPDAAVLLLHPDVEFWAEGTAERGGRTEPYRGTDGFREYLADVDRVWATFTVEPKDFRVAGPGVIAFGDAEGVPREGGELTRESVIWVFRLRDGLIAYGRVSRAKAASNATSEGGKSVRRT